jgi:hypothetical protein
MKVIVRIHTQHGLEIKKAKVHKNNTLWLGKDWKPKLVDYEIKHLWFGRTRFFTDIWENALETWSYKSGLKPDEQPELTQSQVNRYAKAKIWERRYQTDSKAMPNWILYVILVLQIAGMVFTYLVVTGRLRI